MAKYDIRKQNNYLQVYNVLDNCKTIPGLFVFFQDILISFALQKQKKTLRVRSVAHMSQVLKLLSS